MDLSSLSKKSIIKLTIALSLYITSLLAANTLGLKTMPFWVTHVSVSIFFFPFVFLTTDVVGEVYGKSIARLFVLAGFVSVVLFSLYSVLSVALPWAPESAWATEGYNTVFTLSVRMGIASVVAFAVAEYQDVLSFFFLKKRMHAEASTRWFWLRSNISNLWSQFLDTFLFMTIAFAGAGYYSWQELAGLMLTWWLYKVAMGVCYTPLSYVGLWLLGKDGAGEAKA